MMGIDAIVELDKVKIAIQVKKVSYRREVSDRRFTKRQQKHADIFVEEPYLVIDIEESRSKIVNPRTKESTRIKCKNALNIFNKNFIKLNNGFVIFKEEYLKHIRKIILNKLKTTEKGKKITYNEIFMW